MRKIAKTNGLELTDITIVPEEVSTKTHQVASEKVPVVRETSDKVPGKVHSFNSRTLPAPSRRKRYKQAAEDSPSNVRGKVFIDLSTLP